MADREGVISHHAHESYEQPYNADLTTSDTNTPLEQHLTQEGFVNNWPVSRT